MADIQQQPGIRHRVWMGNKVLIRDPLPIQITPRRFETKTRTSNLGLRVDRAYTMEGFPNIRNRREFSLPWRDLREADLLEHLDVLAAVGQPFPLGLFKLETDVFDGDGENTTFYLQRRQLIYAPGGMIPNPRPLDWETRIRVFDKSYLDSTAVELPVCVVQVPQADIDTGGPTGADVWVSVEGEQFGNVWASKVRFGTAPPDATDNIIAHYLPLYEVVIDQENSRSYGENLMEPRALKMVEFG